ncbi:metallophosphoesterase family protein [Candidatus Poribacteria bacterium]
MLADRTTNTSDKKCRFGLISDVHKDVIHDADDRLCAFIQKVQAEQVDFIIQMGDFCIPIPENQCFMNIWNQFKGPKYHVIGNHDTDGDGRNRPNGAYAFTPEETIEYWGIQDRYYSFDLRSIHFIVLDGNDKAENPAPGYRRYIGSDQIEWLNQDLTDTEFPVMLFIHQSLERPGGIENQGEIRTLFESANKEAGYPKVVACFSGHHHRDYVRRINGIIYPQINSASYYWMGGDYTHVRYSNEKVLPAFAMLILGICASLLIMYALRTDPGEPEHSAGQIAGMAELPEERGILVGFYVQEHERATVQLASMQSVPAISSPSRLDKQVFLRWDDLMYYDRTDEERPESGVIMRRPSGWQESPEQKPEAVADVDTISLQEAEEIVSFGIVAPSLIASEYTHTGTRKVKGRECIQLLYSNGTDTLSLFQQSRKAQDRLSRWDFREYVVGLAKDGEDSSVLGWYTDEIIFNLVGKADLQRMTEIADEIKEYQLMDDVRNYYLENMHKGQ